MNTTKAGERWILTEICRDQLIDEKIKTSSFNWQPKSCLNFNGYSKLQIHGYSTRTANNYRVHHCQTNLKNSQFFTKVQRSGIPPLLQSLHYQVFPILRKNCKSFLLNNYWTGKAAHCCTIYVTVLSRTRWPQLKAWWFKEVISPYIKVFIIIISIS